MCNLQVDLKKVVEHVVDTAGHLVKGKVLLEKVVDANTPTIQGDHSRMVQVSLSTLPPLVVVLSYCLVHNALTA